MRIEMNDIIGIYASFKQRQSKQADIDSKEEIETEYNPSDTDFRRIDSNKSQSKVTPLYFPSKQFRF